MDPNPFLASLAESLLERLSDLELIFEGACEMTHAHNTRNEGDGEERMKTRDKEAFAAHKIVFVCEQLAFRETDRKEKELACIKDILESAEQRGMQLWSLIDSSCDRKLNWLYSKDIHDLVQRTLAALDERIDPLITEVTRM